MNDTMPQTLREARSNYEAQAMVYGGTSADLPLLLAARDALDAAIRAYARDERERGRREASDACLYAVDKDRIRALVAPSRSERTEDAEPVRVPVEVTRRTDDDGTVSFDAPGFTTVRACRHCGVLITGGPTACLPCANRPAPAAPQTPERIPGFNEAMLPPGWPERETARRAAPQTTPAPCKRCDGDGEIAPAPFERTTCPDCNGTRAAPQTTPAPVPPRRATRAHWSEGEWTCRYADTQCPYPSPDCAWCGHLEIRLSAEGAAAPGKEK